MTEDVLKDAEERMKKAIEVLHRDLLTIRTGRASPALIEKVRSAVTDGEAPRERGKLARRRDRDERAGGDETEQEEARYHDGCDQTSHRSSFRDVL